MDMYTFFQRRNTQTTAQCAEPDVRQEEGSIMTCLKQLCLSDDMADVTFTFQDGTPSRIPAHKMILAMRSDVFKAMFYGGHDLLGSTDTVDVIDINPGTFQHFLRFVYTDQVDLTCSNVLPLLYASDKYNIKSLSEQCESYLKSILHKGNVCTIYAKAKQLSRHDLQVTTLSFITANAKSVFFEEDFLSLSSDNLEDILAIGTLKIEEIDIFKAVMKWVEAKLEKAKLPVNGTMKRKWLLPNILYLIAIPAVCLEDFTNIVLPSGVLTNEEQLMLFKAITMNQINTSSKFQLHPRKERDAVIIPLFDLFPQRGQTQLEVGATSSTTTSGNVENITLKPYKRIRVVSASINICSLIPVTQHNGNTTITCTALGKSYEAICDYKGKCSIELAVDIPANETRNLVFEISGEYSSTKFSSFNNSYKMPNAIQARQRVRTFTEFQQNFGANSKTFHDPKYGTRFDIKIDGCNIVETFHILML